MTPTEDTRERVEVERDAEGRISALLRPSELREAIALARDSASAAYEQGAAQGVRAGVQAGAEPYVKVGFEVGYRLGAEAGAQAYAEAVTTGLEVALEQALADTQRRSYRAGRRDAIGEAQALVALVGAGGRR
jgi:hypothetical protein